MESQVNLDAQEHIEECHVIIDLQREEIEELKGQLRVALAELRAQRNAQKVEYVG